jgi:hypothetical protein
VAKSAPVIQEQIRLRAYGLYQQHGWEGHELDDWLQAESEVTQQKAKTVIAQNLILKDESAPDSTESRGASFEQPVTGPLRLNAPNSPRNGLTKINTNARNLFG